MIDIVDRLRQVQGDNEDARKAADVIVRLRSALNFLADEINDPALVAVIDDALQIKRET